MPEDVPHSPVGGAAGAPAAERRRSAVTGDVGTRPVRPDGLDKVTGRARFGADQSRAGQLVGWFLRAPHPHARIRRIDTARAEALPGVHAVVTGADFPEQGWEPAQSGDVPVNYAAISAAVMARGRVLYDGQPVAAVAARDAEVARRAVALIEVEYEPLPFVIDPVAAMAPDAPVLHDTLFTEGVTPRPARPSNLASVVERRRGDLAAAMAGCDLVVEQELRTKPVHAGYIEPHACVASVSEDGDAELWVSTQGPWMVRAHCARVLGWDMARIRVIPAEIGGGFGGKTTVIAEPVALLLARKARRPVRIALSRAETLRATGPAPDSRIRVRLGARADGTLVALEMDLVYGAGAFPGSPVLAGAVAAATPYRFEALQLTCRDVVSNRPKTVAYRAPGGPIATAAVEAAIDRIARRLDRDPLELRRQNAVSEGDLTPHGTRFGTIGCRAVLDAARACPHLSAPLGPNQGRGIAAAAWYNMGGQTAAACLLNEDGTVTLTVGTPDVGGLRASLAMMAAGELGIDYGRVKPVIGDTGQLGYNFVSAGSRTTFASGRAAIDATRGVIREVCRRAAEIWGLPIEAVDYRDGVVRPAGPNAGDQPPLTLAEIARDYHRTGGPITGSATASLSGAGQTFGVHIADVEVDPDTGRVTVLRYTVLADAGRAIHPDYVEGQFQGGATQGIGWALNEELIYGPDGRLQNPGFLDYRIPVASDLPMIETCIVEVANPEHPLGVRGVGEISIVPSVGAILNAVSNATGHRFDALPLSPARIRAALSAAGR